MTERATSVPQYRRVLKIKRPVSLKDTKCQYMQATVGQLIDLVSPLGSSIKLKASKVQYFGQNPPEHFFKTVHFIPSVDFFLNQIGYSINCIKTYRYRN